MMGSAGSIEARQPQKAQRVRVEVKQFIITNLQKLLLDLFLHLSVIAPLWSDRIVGRGTPGSSQFIV